MAAVDVLTLAEAKTFLNLTTNDNDAELAGFITAASQMWVNRVGPAIATTYTETYSGVRGSIVLRHTPVISITSVTVAGTALAATDTFLDPVTGILTRSPLGALYSYVSTAVQPVTVTYLAGYSTVPEDIKLAVKLLLAHMWLTQRGSGRRPGTGGDDNPGASYAWPNRVAEIASAYQMPGVRVTGSAIPAVIDALVNTWRNTLGTDAVYDGPSVTSNDPNDYVIVGLPDLDSDQLDEAARSDQGWAWLGHVQRDETVIVHCVAVSWNGDTDQKRARDGVFATMNLITSAIQTDPTFGSSAVLYVQGITSASLRQSQGSDGALAALSFDVTVRARIS